MLEVRNFSVRYGGVVAVAGVELALDAGEVGVISGDFGAGKSSLLNALFGITRHRGEMRLDTQTIHSPRPRVMAKNGVALMQEDAAVFRELKVRDNITVAQRRPLDTSYLARTLEHFPSLTKHLDAPAYALSGGQRQMLGFVRAIASRPRLLLLDEPHIGVAVETIDAFKSIIRGLAEAGTAILATEQSPALVTMATRRWTMANGKLRQGDMM